MSSSNSRKIINSGFSGAFAGRGMVVPSIFSMRDEQKPQINLKSRSISRVIDEMTKTPWNFSPSFNKQSGTNPATKQHINQGGLTIESFYALGDFQNQPIYIKGFKKPSDYCQYLMQDNIDSISRQMGNLASLRNGLVLQTVNVRDFKFFSQESLQKFAEEIAELGFIKTHTRAILLLNELNLPTCFIDHSFEDDIYLFAIHGLDHKLLVSIVEILGKYGEIRSNEAALTFVTGVDNGRLVLKKEQLKGDEIKRAYPSFYPWMKGMTPTEYFLEYMESNANVLMLYGHPGTGKSTMIATACADLGLSALIVTDAALASNPNFIAKLADVMNNEEGGYDVLIIEDGDALMAPRSQGNQGLNSILTATDGLGNTRKFKLVTTTNAKTTENIDPALLRPGRCFDIMEFGPLTPKEAAAVREELKLPPHKFTRSTFLSSVLNPSVKTMKSAQDQDMVIVSPRFQLTRS